jgi:hypothetical protein
MSFYSAMPMLIITLQALEHSLEILKKAVDENKLKETLRGEPVQQVFRKTINFNMKPLKR